MKKITLEDIEQYVNDLGSDSLSVFGGTYEGGAHIQQIPDEIAPCVLAIMESDQPILNYLEIGVAAGGTTKLFYHFLHPEKIVLIDDGKHHKFSMRPGVLEGINYAEVVARSDDEGALQAVSGMLFDLIVIDGDHHYSGVKLDTILYLPLLRPGGFLMLHDSAMTEWGVVRVVKELKADSSMKFIGEYVSEIHKPCGVALFRKGK